ncbi:TonB-dependent siderophore receptor, partial [Steroidobacter sp.]|uniref:TonB-dependent siderophore receptor n=1 Tax=Steroidobacter sp. TaxID=1978227 RepID=UPI001A46E5F7
MNARTSISRPGKPVLALALSAWLATLNPLPAFAEEAHGFDIAAMDASAALRAFGKQAGVEVMASGELLGGKTLNRVSGEQSVDAALQSLLAGSGLTHRYVGDRGVVLLPVKAAETIRIAQANTAVGMAQKDEVREEVIVIGRARLYDKTGMDLKEIPQSVSIVTRQRLDDQNLTSLSEAMKYTTGVTVQRFDAGGHMNTFNARGFGSEIFQFDGLAVRSTGNLAVPDLAMFERVEVMRGAAGMFQGAGEPGVAINMIRKRAQSNFQINGLLSAGSWDNYRGELDVTGAFTDSGNIRGRLVTAVQTYDTYMDDIGGDKQLAYGTVEFDLAEQTTLSVGGIYHDYQTAQFRGLPSYVDGRLPDLERSTTLAPDWARQNMGLKDGFVQLEHRLSNDGFLNTVVRKTNRTLSSTYLDYLTPVAYTGAVTIGGGYFNYKDEDTSADTFFSTPFQLGGRTHNFLIGADYRLAESTQWFRNTSASAPTAVVINLFSPPDLDLLPDPNQVAPAGRNLWEIESYGSYSQLRAKPSDSLTLIAGGRLSWWETQVTSKVTGATLLDYDAKNEFTPFGGIVFELNPSVSVYASYAEVFQPQSGYTVAGTPLEPRVGAQLETGIKGSLMGGRVNASAAVFRINDDNRALSDP